MTPKPVDIAEKPSLVHEQRLTKRVGRIDDYDVRPVRLTGEFIRHSYADADGFFSGTDGVLRMRFRERYEDEGAGAFIVLPTSVQHEPEALTPETCVLLVEKAGTVNTGDGPANPRTVAGSEFI